MLFYYVTSSSSKIASAKRHLSPYGLDVEQKFLDMVEIQSHLGEEILKHKAEQAFDFLKQPLIVSDHFWYIPALRGFPGAYMKHVNEWFTPEDFLNLIQPYEDRSVFIEEFLCFTDGKEKKLFRQKINGTFLPERRGKEDSFRSIISLRKDGKSIAECWEKNINSIDGAHPLWQQFAQWYIK